MEDWQTLEPDLGNVAAGFEVMVTEMEAVLGAPLEDLVADWESLLEEGEKEDRLAGEYALALKNYVFRRRPPQGERWLRAGLVAWAAVGQRRRVGLFCNELGLIYAARGEYGAALEWYERSVALKEELGDKAGLATSYNNIGLIHKARGEYGAALGDKAGLATTLHNMGYVALATKDLSLALTLFTRSRDIYAAIDLEKDVAEEEEMIEHVKALVRSGKT